MNLGPTKVVTRGSERIRLHYSVTGRLDEIKFKNNTRLTEPPHTWRFPCLAPENVMAVLLHMTDRRLPNKVSLLASLLALPSPVSNFNDQLLHHLFGVKGAITTQLSLTTLPHLAPAVNETTEEAMDEEMGDEEFEMGEDTDDEDSDGSLTDGC